MPKPSSSTPRRTRLRQAASTFPGRLIQLVRDLDEVWLAPALKRSDNTLDLDLRIFLRTAVVIFCTTPMYHTSARGHAFQWPEALRIGFVALAQRRWSGSACGEPIAAVSVIGVAGLLIGGWPICKEAFESAVMALSALPESVTKRTSGGHGRIAKYFVPLTDISQMPGDWTVKLALLGRCPLRLLEQFGINRAWIQHHPPRSSP